MFRPTSELKVLISPTITPTKKEKFMRHAFLEITTTAKNNLKADAKRQALCFALSFVWPRRNLKFDNIKKAFGKLTT